MASVFKKLISDELGETKYNKYFYVCQKSLHSKVFDSREIYFDIYEHLKNKDKPTIKKMQGRLNDSIVYAMRISKTYYFSFLFLLAAIFYLFAKKFDPIIIVVSIIIMSISFLVKTYEYLINKYCFIDAQIVLVYKTVLDKISLLKEIEKSSRNPTENPTENPTGRPAGNPTENPTENPRETPTEIPTGNPTEIPIGNPTEILTEIPTENQQNNQ